MERRSSSRRPDRTCHGWSPGSCSTGCTCLTWSTAQCTASLASSCRTRPERPSSLHPHSSPWHHLESGRWKLKCAITGAEDDHQEDQREHELLLPRALRHLHPVIGLWQELWMNEVKRNKRLTEQVLAARWERYQPTYILTLSSLWIRWNVHYIQGAN